MTKSILISLLLITTLLAGCMPSPKAEATGCDQLKEELEGLQAEYSNLLEALAKLEKSKEDCKAMYDRYNSLAANYTSLQTKYAVLEGSYQSLNNQYTQLAAQINARFPDCTKALEDMNERYQELAEGHAEIDGQIEKVRNKQVQLLSDNLTKEEYNAFYKGLDLWWWSWHEKDEEE